MTPPSDRTRKKLPSSPRRAPSGPRVKYSASCSCAPRPGFPGAARLQPAAGFTLLELLAAVAIVGVLAALLMAGLSRAKSSATGAVCLGNLRQLATATVSYMADNSQQYPASNNWAYQLLPYLADRPGTLADGTLYFSSISPKSSVFFCPGADRQTLNGNTAKYRYGSGVIAYGINATTVANAAQSVPITPWVLQASNEKLKLSRLMLYGEGNLLNLFWGDDARCAEGRHGPGMNVAFCDFHVEHVPYRLTDPNFQNLYFGYDRFK